MQHHITYHAIKNPLLCEKSDKQQTLLVNEQLHSYKLAHRWWPLHFTDNSVLFPIVVTEQRDRRRIQISGLNSYVLSTVKH